MKWTEILKQKMVGYFPLDDITLEWMSRPLFELVHPER